jgi:uncharacterized protein YrrD
MRLELGATVRTADGEDAGAIDQLVVDSERRTIAYFILRTGHFANHDYIVPIDAITSVDNDNTIHLVFTSAQLRELPEFETENFVTSDIGAAELHQAMPEGDNALLVTPSSDAQWRYITPTGSGGIIVPAGPSGRETPEGRVYDPGGDDLIGVQDSTGDEVTTISSIPEWDYRIDSGTKVVTRDDHTVGSFHEVDIDGDGKPQAIVVVSGLFHRKRHAIPMEHVRSADSEQILLNMTRDEYEQLAEQAADTTEKT